MLSKVCKSYCTLHGHPTYSLKLKMKKKSILFLTIYVLLFPSVNMSALLSIYLFLCLPVYLSTCPHICLSVCLSACPSACFLIYQSISICLSICLYACTPIPQHPLRNVTPPKYCHIGNWWKSLKIKSSLKRRGTAADGHPTKRCTKISWTIRDYNAYIIEPKSLGNEDEVYEESAYRVR